MKRILAELKYPQFFGTPGVPVRLHFRNDLHLARKGWHLTMGLMMALIFQSGLSVPASVVLLGFFLSLSLMVEAVRLRSPSFNEKMIRLWGPVMRQCEVDRMTGVTYYLAATLIAVSVFPRPVAVMSILFLACGDPVASLIGILYGNRSIRFSNGKSLIGTLAGVMTCSIVAYVVLHTLSLPPTEVWILTMVGGIAGGTAELMPFEADDNFTIPVISGFVMWFMFIVLGV